jgi:hypothetical protein
MNVSYYIKREYDKMDTWSHGKNKPNSNPIQTQFKANTKPKQTQYKAKQTQFHMILAYFSSREKNTAFHLFAVGYLRKRLYSVTLLIGNIRLISHLTAKEKLK